MTKSRSMRQLDETYEALRNQVRRARRCGIRSKVRSVRRCRTE